MFVSVIVCAYDLNRYSDLVDAVISLLNQTYSQIEVICIVDGTEPLYMKILADDSGVFSTVKNFLNEKNLGLSESRNRGIAHSKGDIIAFFDDDAVADPNWVSELVRMYEEYDAIAAGGKLVPLWIAGKANFIPEEFYWMIGATHKGFPEEVIEVRNTFGSNISFKREVLDNFDGFKGEMGIKASGALQCEETEICERMKKVFGKGVMYNPNAIVHHKVFESRMKLKFLFRRAFWQGYSKRMMKEMGYPMDVEGKFLQNLVKDGIFGRIKKIHEDGTVAIVQIMFLIMFTISVLLGYLFRAVMPKKF